MLKSAAAARNECPSIPEKIHATCCANKALDSPAGRPAADHHAILGTNASTTAFYAFEKKPGHDAQAIKAPTPAITAPRPIRSRRNSKPSTVCESHRTLSRGIREHPRQCRPRQNPRLSKPRIIRMVDNSFNPEHVRGTVRWTARSRRDHRVAIVDATANPGPAC